MSQKCIKMHNTLYKSLCISTLQLIADFSSMEMSEEDREGKGSGYLENASKWLDMTLPISSETQVYLSVRNQIFSIEVSLSYFKIICFILTKPQLC